MSSLPQNSFAISHLRAAVTDANVNYVGSVTVDAVLCDCVGLSDRQLVQIRNETTGVDLYTYVIYGRRSESVVPGTLCLNGAAAHLVSIGDIVNVIAWATFPADIKPAKIRSWDSISLGCQPSLENVPAATWASLAMIEVAVGKVHRPRLTKVMSCSMASTNFPSVSIDSEWASEAGIAEGRSTHIVNVTTGQRDILPVVYAERGSRECCVYMNGFGKYATNGYGSRAGHFVGDIVILMTYGLMRRSKVVAGDIPPIKIAFPFERQQPY